MYPDNITVELEAEERRKAINEDVRKMRELMPEVFRYFDPSINSMAELLSVMRQHAAVDVLYAAKLKNTYINVSS